MHTADAIWAFELGHRAAEIASRLGVPKLRFAAGPVPEQPGTPGQQPLGAVVQPSPEHEDRAAAMAATVEDEELRERIARAAALSLAKAAADRSF